MRAAPTDLEDRWALLSFFGGIQPHKELIVCAVVYLTKLNKDAGTDVQLTGFILGVSGSANVAATALEFGAKLFLRQATLTTQSAQVVTHVPIPTDLLLHSPHLAYN